MPIATFNGKHNKVKSIVLLLLYNQKYHDRPGLDISNLVRLTHFDYNSLQGRLRAMAGFEYIKREPGVNASGRPVFIYSIAARGKRFIEERLPFEKRQEYVVYLNTVRTAR